MNESELENWLSKQNYRFDNTLSLATEDFWACDLQVYHNPQTGRYALHQLVYHALIEECLYVNISSESAVEDLSEVLNQRLETINSHLNSDGRIQVVSPFIDPSPENSSRRHSLQLWLVYQSCECELSQTSPDSITQPLLDVDHVFLGAEWDDDDRFVGYFVATRCGLEGDLLSENWREQGWQLRRQERLFECSSGCWEGSGRVFDLSDEQICS